MSVSRPSKTLGTVLVLGGCGFLGGHVVDQLLSFPSEDSATDAFSAANGSTKAIHSTTSVADAATLTFPPLRTRYPSYEDTTVHVIDLKCSRNTFPGAIYHEADITSPEALLPIFRKVKPAVIINTVSPHVFSPKSVLQKVNIKGTRTLLEVTAGIHGDWGGICKAFVHTSSSSVIHDTVSHLLNADEDYPLVIPNPGEYYSESKAVAEQIVLNANRSKEFNTLLTCAIRPAGIVGEGDYGGFTSGVLVTASTAADWQLQVQLGDGANLFDSTYVGNVVYAHLLAAEALVQTYDLGITPLNHEKIDGEAFIVTNDSPTYFWDASRFLWVHYGRQIDTAKLWVVPEAFATFTGRVADLFSWLTGRQAKLTAKSAKYACMHRYYSCEKLKRRLGYAPVIGIEEGLLRSVKNYAIEERKLKSAEASKNGSKIEQKSIIPLGELEKQAIE